MQFDPNSYSEEDRTLLNIGSKALGDNGLPRSRLLNPVGAALSSISLGVSLKINSPSLRRLKLFTLGSSFIGFSHLIRASSEENEKINEAIKTVKKNEHLFNSLGPNHLSLHYNPQNQTRLTYNKKNETFDRYNCNLPFLGASNLEYEWQIFQMRQQIKKETADFKEKTSAFTHTPTPGWLAQFSQVSGGVPHVLNKPLKCGHCNCSKTKKEVVDETLY